MVLGRPGQWVTAPNATSPCLRHLSEIVLDRAAREAKLRDQIVADMRGTTETRMISRPPKHSEPFPRGIELGVERRAAWCGLLDAREEIQDCVGQLPHAFVRRRKEIAFGGLDELDHADVFSHSPAASRQVRGVASEAGEETEVSASPLAQCERHVFPAVASG